MLRAICRTCNNSHTVIRLLQQTIQRPCKYLVKFVSANQALNSMWKKKGFTSNFLFCILKAKRGFEVDFFKKCVPGVHAWLYIFPKHDLVIQRELEFIWPLICDTQAL